MVRDKLETLHHALKGMYLDVQSLVKEGIDLNRKNSFGHSPLMAAARLSDNKVIELLINSGEDIHCCDNEGLSVLHHASCQELVEQVQYFLDKGIDPDVNDNNGKTPLMYATHRDVAELLISSGANIHCCDDKGWTVLHHASCQGSVEMVLFFVNKGIDPDVKDADGKTPLMCAPHTEVAELLISSGAKIHCCDDKGWTVLHHASCQGSVQMVLFFVNKGIYLDIKDSNGKTPLMCTAHTEVAELLISSGADIHCCDDEGLSVLHHASCQGSVEMMRFFVNKGIDLDVKDSDGKTPLMCAANTEVAELLISLGADIHCCDDEGLSVLHRASCQGSVELVQYFLNKGIDPDKKGTCGQTSLILAAQNSNREVSELLIRSGADIHCCDDEGWNALHDAAFQGSVEIAQCLVNNGVDPNAKNTDGQTPLMFAAENPNREVFELLISSGADINCCDDNGWIALHYAAEYRESFEIVQILVNKGVNIDIKNVYGDTPLQLAVKCGGMEIAECLLKAGADCNLEGEGGESPFNYLVRVKRHYVETIKLCIEKGAYVTSTDYNRLLKDPLLNKVILQDVKLCSQAIINNFNNKDLPFFYKGLTSVQKLPHIDKLKIGNESGMVLEIEQCVTHEIQSKGFCNVFGMVPLSLGMLCVRSSIEK